MLIGNQLRTNRNCTRDLSLAQNSFTHINPCVMMNFYTSGVGNSVKLSAFNHGYNSEYAYVLPLKSGGIASTNQIIGNGSLVANALAVKLALADLTGSGDLEAIGGLIIQALADLTGSGSVSDADIKAFLLAAASISGSGGATSTISALAQLLSSLSGSGGASNTLTGVGELDCDITVTGSGLSTANVGNAVWSVLAAANNATGTMGEKMNDAGSGSNPWTEVIESGLTAAEIMRIILAVQSGKTNIDGTTVTFRDAADTKDRVVAEMTDSERTSVTLDGS